jgi:hypothetical protein
MTVTVTPPLAAGGTDPLAAAAAGAERQVENGNGLPDIVDVWGHGSFPASDAPANW